jgi:hypothetical protein
VSEKLENKLERNSAQTNSVVEELTNKMMLNEVKTEIEKSVTETQRMNRDLLYRFRSETNEYTRVISEYRRKRKSK